MTERKPAKTSTHRGRRWEIQAVQKAARRDAELKRLQSQVDPEIINEAKEVVIAATLRLELISDDRRREKTISLRDDQTGTYYTIEDYSALGTWTSDRPMRILIADPNAQDKAVSTIRLPNRLAQINNASKYLNQKEVPSLIQGLGEVLIRARQISELEFIRAPAGGIHKPAI